MEQVGALRLREAREVGKEGSRSCGVLRLRGLAGAALRGILRNVLWVVRSELNW